MSDTEPFLPLREDEDFPRRTNEKDWKKKIRSNSISTYIHVALILLYVIFGVFFIRSSVSDQQCPACKFHIKNSERILKRI
jgi:hypothetical protein